VNVIRTDVKRVERYCNEHLYIVNKRVSISEKTGDLNSRPKQFRSEIMNYMLPRHRRKNNRRKYNKHCKNYLSKAKIINLEITQSTQ